MNQATIEFKNYFLSAAGAAGAAASAGLASAAGAAAGAAGASAAGAAAGAGAAGAAASSFLPQAANAAAAMMAAKTRDLFMMIFLNRGIKTISGNCQRSLQCAYKTAATERKHSSSFISACDYRGFHAHIQSHRDFCKPFDCYAAPSGCIQPSSHQSDSNSKAGADN